MVAKVSGGVIPMRALTAGEKAELAKGAPTREALWRYLTPPARPGSPRRATAPQRPR